MLFAFSCIILYCFSNYTWLLAQRAPKMDPVGIKSRPWVDPKRTKTGANKYEIGSVVGLRSDIWSFCYCYILVEFKHFALENPSRVETTIFEFLGHGVFPGPRSWAWTLSRSVAWQSVWKSHLSVVPRVNPFHFELSHPEPPARRRPGWRASTAPRDLASSFVRTCLRYR